MQSTHTANATPMRVVVVIEGGIVQDVIADMPLALTVIDYDVAADAVLDETYAIPQQGDRTVAPAYRSTQGALVDPSRVDDLIGAPLHFDYDAPISDLVKRWMNCRVELPWPAREQRVLWRASFALDACPFEFSYLIPAASIEAAQALATRCLNEIWPDQVEKLDQSFLAGQAVQAVQS